LQGPPIVNKRNRRKDLSQGPVSNRTPGWGPLALLPNVADERPKMG
jgi:hypothetical protein